MFQWAAEGDGLNTIAVRLNEAGVLSPSHYKKRLGEITHENLIGNGNWQTRTVAKILRAGRLCRRSCAGRFQGHRPQTGQGQRR